MVHPWYDVDTGDEAPHVFAAIERYRTTAPDRGAHARHP